MKSGELFVIGAACGLIGSISGNLVLALLLGGIGSLVVKVLLERHSAGTL